MLANIKGLVDRLELSQAKAMMPLFEAISNAIDAIEEHRDGFASHAIQIRLVAAHDLAHQGGDEVFVVDGFDIRDDELGLAMTTLLRFKRRIPCQKSKLAVKVLAVLPS
ncbi:MAG TPA: hypothetical protein PKN13_13005 [Accumulibacter sp.]|nr:hypothetical protein [Accumulibacter sp.]HNC91788.1 hypothetical protein [Anaerolineales bacterium]HND81170.1 hypothetical protein [Accumulibacter sp.]HNG39033.1 hypothetical protein [Accumulibacter sp.]HNL78125.1 hypothetical protein [Accumulibacter sp.]